MPYSNTSELPKSVKDRLSPGKQRQWMATFNAIYGRTDSEGQAFAGANAAVKKAMGYKNSKRSATVTSKSDTNKATPTMTSVHVPNAGDDEKTRKADFKVGDRVEWNSSGGKAQGVIRQIVTSGTVPGIDGDVKVTGSKDKPAARISVLDDDGKPTDTTVGHKLSTLSSLKKAESFTPPAAARAAAKQALRWKDKYGDEVKGGTQVGWTRANQLASGEKISRDIVSRMAQFARHKKNSKVDQKYKDEPWKDAGHVAYKLWGGDAGVEWAQSVMDKLQKLSGRNPLSGKTRTSIDKTEEFSQLKASCDNNFPPSIFFTALKSDVTRISKALDRIGTPYMCTDTSSDSHTLFALPNINVPVTINPSTDVMWKKFLWDVGGDEVVSFSFGDSPFSKTFSKFQAANSTDSIRKDVSVARRSYSDVSFTSDGSSEHRNVVNIYRSDRQSVATAWEGTDTSIRKQKPCPVSSFRCVFVEKGTVPSGRVRRTLSDTPTPMRTKNSLLFEKVSNTGRSTLHVSGDFNCGNPLPIQVKDFSLMFGSEKVSGHVAWNILGGGKLQVEKSNGARSLYAYRPLLNAEDVISHYKAQGVTTMLLPDDMHVTVAYSKDPIRWNDEAIGYQENLRVDSGPRMHQILGGKAFTLCFDAPSLVEDWLHFRRNGAGYDYPSYQPHVTLTYNPPEEDIIPYSGPLIFGAVRMEEIDPPETITEKRRIGIESEDDEVSEIDGAIERVVRTVMDSVLAKSFTIEADVVKAEQQIAYGWASVVSIDGKELVDKQGHVITSAEMEKMANSFMMSQRVAKEMHTGGSVGEVIHSMPITKQLMETLNLKGDTEGWLIGVKINDPDVWKRVKDGTLKAFSIGGKGVLTDV